MHPLIPAFRSSRLGRALKLVKWTRGRFEQFPVDPRPVTETIALRVLGVILWVAGTAWIFVMLRARHAVTLGVMLVRQPCARAAV